MSKPKNPNLDRSPEARAERTRLKRKEMEEKGCPFGRYENGIPRTRPEVPPELRSYYVLYGMPKHGNAIQYVARFKSQLQAARDIEKWSSLLGNNYATLELVRCKRVRFVEL